MPISSVGTHRKARSAAIETTGLPIAVTPPSAAMHGRLARPAAPSAPCTAAYTAYGFLPRPASCPPTSDPRPSPSMYTLTISVIETAPTP